MASPWLGIPLLGTSRCLPELARLTTMCLFWGVPLTVLSRQGPPHMVTPNSSIVWTREIASQVGLPVPVLERVCRTVETKFIGCGNECVAKVMKSSGHGGGRVSDYPCTLGIAAVKHMLKENAVYYNGTGACQWRTHCRFINPKTTTTRFCKDCLKMMVFEDENNEC